MDEMVKAALRKWPNVPDCYGWLALDRRGDWYLRDDGAQAAGPFVGGGPGSRGDRLEHEGLRAFVGRNYGVDAQGAWFFQNGPQRVYVELECAPWVWHLDGQGRLCSHTGQTVPAAPTGLWLDEAGHAYLDSPWGLGLLHSQDMGWLADQIEQGRWVPQTMAWADLSRRFGFVSSPQAHRLVAGHKAQVEV